MRKVVVRFVFWVLTTSLLAVAMGGEVSRTVLALRAEPQEELSQDSPNLLQNPGFEGDYFAWGGINEVQVAHGWTPWWRKRTEADPEAYYFQPEYKQANGYIYPNRVHGGAAAQQWFTFHATHEAGMYQQVFNVTPGVRYRFTIWAQVWSSVEDDPDHSVDPAYPNLQLGIDPTGNWNPWDSDVVWSGTYAYFDHWGQLAVEAVAQNSVITVFMRSAPNFPVKHNDMYWDDAVLVAVGQGEVPAPPTQPPSATATSGPPVPTATCAVPPADWVTYYVQRGDTLFSLAQRHGTSLEAVMAANCLRSTGIYVGQALLLPPLAATATATPVSPTPTPQPSATPTATTPASPTAAPPTSTATPPPVAAATVTATRPRPTLPSLTPTAASPVLSPSPTSPPAESGGRPCGTIALGAGIVMVAGMFRFRRRRK